MCMCIIYKKRGCCEMMNMCIRFQCLQLEQGGVSCASFKMTLVCSF